jgi:hypothetical protein
MPPKIQPISLHHMNLAKPVPLRAKQPYQFRRPQWTSASSSRYSSTSSYSAPVLIDKPMPALNPRAPFHSSMPLIFNKEDLEDWKWEEAALKLLLEQNLRQQDDLAEQVVDLKGRLNDPTLSPGMTVKMNTQLIELIKQQEKKLKIEAYLRRRLKTYGPSPKFT